MIDQPGDEHALEGSETSFNWPIHERGVPIRVLKAIWRSEAQEGSVVCMLCDGPLAAYLFGAALFWGRIDRVCPTCEVSHREEVGRMTLEVWVRKHLPRELWPGSSSVTLEARNVSVGLTISTTPATVPGFGALNRVTLAERGFEAGMREGLDGEPEV
ncbi:MAG: hypothetical protein HYV07_03715 [Deltaproteobacteria bacterium]|nr:hypothetical protein [Deltaproteobacteria bacterium]